MAIRKESVKLRHQHTRCRVVREEAIPATPLAGDTSDLARRRGTAIIASRFGRPALLLLALVSAPGETQGKPNNYDEAKVGTYTLPDPIVGSDGVRVRNAHTWQTTRRAEVLELFRTHMYGRSPGRPEGMRFEITQTDSRAFGGMATRKEVTVHLGAAADAPQMHLLLYIPNTARKPVPAFLGLNFEGNHTIARDPGISIMKEWRWDMAIRMAGRPDTLIEAADSTRGTDAEAWQVDRILARGYALVTVSHRTIEPTYENPKLGIYGWKRGVRAFFLRQAGRTELAADEWGAIAAWAWGLSRALDYLETDPAIDAKRVAVMGHSRFGKAALWAGAQDERFAIVISNNSGEGGASLTRRDFGESIANMNPSWHCANYGKYKMRPEALPFDQHMLIALVAPRPVYVASASQDKQADPRGEFLAAKYAEPVYRLFGKVGLGVNDLPPVNTAVGDVIGYHLREGGHAVTAYDWEQYLRFADRHFSHSHHY